MKSNEKYTTIAETAKYELALVHGQHRIYDRKTKHVIDYCDIPAQQAESFKDYLTEWKSYGLVKAQGITLFDRECKEIMTNEWAEYKKNETQEN